MLEASLFSFDGVSRFVSVRQTEREAGPSPFDLLAEVAILIAPEDARLWFGGVVSKNSLRQSPDFLVRSSRELQTGQETFISQFQNKNEDVRLLHLLKPLQQELSARLLFFKSEGPTFRACHKMTEVAVDTSNSDQITLDWFLSSIHPRTDVLNIKAIKDLLLECPLVIVPSGYRYQNFSLHFRSETSRDILDALQLAERSLGTTVSVFP